MKILITGGTGFIGRELIKLLMTHDLVCLTRNSHHARQRLAHVHNDKLTFIESLDDLHDLNRFDAVINLAGEPIADKRWTEQQKQRICDSRWNLTERLVELFHASTKPPHVLISGSAVGYYGDQQEHPFDESLQVSSQRFSHQVCATWEQIALRAQSDQTRVCIMRTGVVLAPEGGALKKMLPPYRLGLGGPIGSGQQYMPWIHMSDMVKAIVYVLETEHAQGIFNFSAPHPVTNRRFSRCLAQTLKRPHILTTPKWAIRLLMGEASELLFDSIRAKPKKLTELGFQFTYSRVEPALKHLLQHHV
ncbi:MULTISPECIES: TIGR01777 family oxidoreductase [Vibrio]|uniref:TIGR01777 family oxidoreductase n=1 Tax=Vibrio ostreae TaxID=2841925 RepID=A0A975U7I9_9VIBR|nr:MULTISPECIES: TIGR01777 family oxidoreductase [Vibrio]QXO16645.1 TIGR01777 family oxidoreductase [Vibrio ostreae]WGY46349.1 TIGR01777 family oxidoreductase [Vibrio sp. ABG19]